jgi:uncharacterized protein with GYD domain
MALYLTKFSYTPETWAKLVANPEDRRKAAETYIESVGGRLHGFWYAFGSHDGYNLWEAPDNVSMAAVAIAIGAGRSRRSRRPSCSASRRRSRRSARRRAFATGARASSARDGPPSSIPRICLRNGISLSLKEWLEPPTGLVREAAGVHARRVRSLVPLTHDSDRHRRSRRAERGGSRGKGSCRPRSPSGILAGSRGPGPSKRRDRAPAGATGF